MNRTNVVCIWADDATTVWLREVLGCAVAGPDGEHLGHLRDIAGVAGPGGSPVCDLISIECGGFRLLLALDAGSVFRPGTALRHGRLVLGGQGRPGGPATRRLARTWLTESVLGMPVALGSGPDASARIDDVGLHRLRDGRWAVRFVDTRSRWYRRCGRARRPVAWGDLTRRDLLLPHGTDARPEVDVPPQRVPGRSPVPRRRDTPAARPVRRPCRSGALGGRNGPRGSTAAVRRDGATSRTGA